MGGTPMPRESFDLAYAFDGLVTLSICADSSALKFRFFKAATFSSTCFGLDVADQGAGDSRKP